MRFKRKMAENRIKRQTGELGTVAQTFRPTDGGWTEDVRKHLDAFAGEDHSYIATWYERTRYEKVWTMNDLQFNRIPNIPTH